MTIPKHELEAKLFYCLVVAGKSAKFANEVINKWMAHAGVCDKKTPFEAVANLIEHNCLVESLKAAKTGNYTKISKALEGIIKSDPPINLETCTPEDLETIYGIGPKTSRFFILWTRPDEKYAVLDVHILRWLTSLGFEVPSSTPQSRKKYKEIEQIFLGLARDKKMTPRELDLMIWTTGAQEENIIPG